MGPIVGQLLYGHSARSTHFSDRVLFHLQIVVSTKLRRHESFFLSWREGDDALAFVRDLYAAVQSVLELSLNRWLPPDMADALMKAVLENLRKSL